MTHASARPRRPFYTGVLGFRLGGSGLIGLRIWVV